MAHNYRFGRSFTTLLERTIEQIEKAMRDIPTRVALAQLLGALTAFIKLQPTAPWKRMHIVSRMAIQRERTWVTAAALILIGPCAWTRCSSSTISLRQSLRDWLWHSIDRYHADSWQHLVKNCVDATLIEAWPEIENWTRQVRNHRQIYVVDPPRSPTTTVEVHRDATECRVGH